VVNDLASPAPMDRYDSQITATLALTAGLTRQMRCQPVHDEGEMTPTTNITAAWFVEKHGRTFARLENLVFVDMFWLWF
jgi:hypothetical protein